MNSKHSHIPTEWLFPPSLEKATEVQHLLASHVQLQDAFDPIQFIGGMDVSNNLNDPDQIIYASAVVLDKKSLQVQEQFAIAQQQRFPYIPGFLGFREAPSLVEAFKGLKQTPQLIMVDGHGISHPRGLGIASHIGVLLDLPTIGVAKSILVGKLEGTLGPLVGDQVPLMWKGKQIATVLRTKLRCNPLIISSGHRVSLSTAVDLVLNCLTKYRLPEPTRQAHLASNARRRLGTNEKQD
jgi:deoxyribonuclease V